MEKHTFDHSAKIKRKERGRGGPERQVRGANYN